MVVLSAMTCGKSDREAKGSDASDAMCGTLFNQWSSVCTAAHALAALALWREFDWHSYYSERIVSDGNHRRHVDGDRPAIVRWYIMPSWCDRV
jgi:hypothetical protein